MSIKFRAPATSANLNDAFLSRTVDTSTEGKLKLENDESATVEDVQQSINDHTGQIADLETDVQQAAEDLDTHNGKATDVHGLHPTDDGEFVGTHKPQTLYEKSIAGSPSVTIGTNDLDPSSVFDVNSTTKGTRPYPLMTQTQRDAITSPAKGLTIFNTDIDQVEIYDGNSWEKIGGVPEVDNETIEVVSGEPLLSSTSDAYDAGTKSTANINGTGDYGYSVMLALAEPKTIGSIIVSMERAGTQTGTLVSKIYQNNGSDAPGTLVVASATVDPNTFSNDGFADVQFVFPSTDLIAGSYFISVEASAGFSGFTMIQVLNDTPDDFTSFWYDNSDWATTAAVIKYDLYAAGMDTLRVLNEVAQWNADKIQGLEVPAPTIDDDGKAIIFDHVNQTYKYGKAGGGAGAGGINYIPNPDAETNTDGWSALRNTTGSSEPDIPNSASLIQAVVVRNNTNPLRGTADFKLEINTAWAGITFCVPFTIDNTDKSKALSVSFDYRLELTDDADATAMLPYLWDDENDVVVPLTRSSNSSRFSGVFTATDAVNYQLLFYYAGEVTAPYALYVDNVQVGPQRLLNLPRDTEWTLFDMEVRGSTSDPTKATSPAVDIAYWRRDGNEMRIRYDYRQANSTGAAAGSGTYLFTIPNGLTIDTDQAYVTGNIVSSVVGAGAHSGNNTNYLSCVVKAFDSTSLSMMETTLGNVGSSTGFASSENVRYSFEAAVPIAEWSSQSDVLTTSKLLNQTAATSVSGSSGSHTSSTAYQTITSYSTTNFDSGLSLDTSTGILTATEKTRVLAIGSIDWETNTVGQRNARLIQAGSAAKIVYGDRINANSAGRTFSQVCGIFELEAGDTLKVDGFQSSGGTLSYAYAGTLFEVVTLPDFSLYGVNGVYEIVSAESDTETSTATTTWINTTGNSVTLSPGTWELDGTIEATSAGNSAPLEIVWATWSTSNGDDTSTYPGVGGLDFEGRRDYRYQPVSGAGDTRVLTVPINKIVATITSETTFYLIPRLDYSTGTTHTAKVTILAKRLR